MRFFDIDIAAKNFPGTYGATSETASAEFCFDGLSYTRWVSSGKGTDGDAIYVFRNFGVERTITRIFVKNTNIKDPSIWVIDYSGDATFCLQLFIQKSPVKMEVHF
jgi:hypothetical protein